MAIPHGCASDKKQRCTCIQVVFLQLDIRATKGLDLRSRLTCEIPTFVASVGSLDPATITIFRNQPRENKSKPATDAGTGLFAAQYVDVTFRKYSLVLIDIPSGNIRRVHALRSQPKLTALQFCSQNGDLLLKQATGNIGLMSSDCARVWTLTDDTRSDCLDISVNSQMVATAWKDHIKVRQGKASAGNS